VKRAVLLTIGATGAAQAAPEVATVQFPEHVFVTGFLSTDVDLDGRDDLVLALRDETAARRRVHVHLQQAGEPRLRGEPSLPPYVVETDVVAFTYADVLPAKGRELVLLTSERVVAVTRGDDGAPAYRPLLAHALVWPAADPEFVLPLAEARCDFDGDGRDDLLLPEPDGVRLALRPGTDAAPVRELRLPAWRSRVAAAGGPAPLSGDELRLRLQFAGDGEGDDGEVRGPLASRRARTPPGFLVDLDGDGRLDLAAVRNDTLFVGSQDGGSELRPKALPLPMPGDRLALFDPSFDVQLRDVDGDGRADLLLTTSASRNDEIEVRVDLFATGPGGTWSDKPDSRLRVQPLAAPPRLVDADGDGRLDLVVLTLRTDALRSFTGGAPSAVDAQLTVFAGAGDRFTTPPLLNVTLRLPAAADRLARPFVHVLPGSGGQPGAVLVRAEDGLARRPLQRRGDRLALGAPSSRLPLAETARPHLASEGGSDVVVISDHEALLVRLP